MAEWLVERGIGETRAALVEDGMILAARIEPDDHGLLVGAILPARLIAPDRARLDDNSEVMLTARAPVTQGARLNVEITREVIPEPGRVKLAHARPTDAPIAPGPTLFDRAMPHRLLHAHDADALEAAGWSEVLDEALTGDIAFDGGMLRMTPTPAMTLFDVDGGGDLAALAERAAGAVARAIERHGIGGSIGIDFPTLAGKAARQGVGEAIDAALPFPFERTAMNGFGFLQIVRPRPRASLPELLRSDPVAARTRAALRTLERIAPGTPNRHRLPPAILACLDQHLEWLAELVRRTGRTPTFDR